jgi:hypothetical protein
MLHNVLLNLINRSTCFGHHYAHHQELATIQMTPACGSSPWLWQVAGLVHATSLYPDAQPYTQAPDHNPAITKVRSHKLGPSAKSQASDDGHSDARNTLSDL